MIVRVLLADPQAEVRSALKLLLEQEIWIRIVGEVSRGSSLLEQVESTSPDTLLIDWALPGLPGTDLLPALKAIDPHLKVIVLSGRPEKRKEALSSGADAFVCKAEPPEQLLGALRRVTTTTPETL